MPRWVPLGIAGLLLAVALFAWRQDGGTPAPIAAAPPPTRMAAMAAPALEAPEPDARDASGDMPFPALLDESEEMLRAPRARRPDARSAEEKRFARYDRNRDGAVSQSEYLYLRRGNFRRLDTDGDGRLSFEEYAAEGIVKFARADADDSGRLDAREFATTAVKRRLGNDCDAPARSERTPARADRGDRRASPEEPDADA